MAKADLKASTKLFSLEDLGSLAKGCLVLGQDLSIAYVCEDFSKSLNYAPDGLIGQNVDVLLGEPTIYWFKSNVAQAFKNESLLRHELTFLDADHEPSLKAVAILRCRVNRKTYYVLLEEERRPRGIGIETKPGRETPMPFGDVEATLEPARKNGLCSLSDVERGHIKRILLATNGNRTKASEILGISRVTLLTKIKQYQLDGA